jgi:hypothetical protein
LHQFWADAYGKEVQRLDSARFRFKPPLTTLGAGNPSMQGDEWGLSFDHTSFFGGNYVDLNREPIRRPSSPFTALELGKNVRASM